VSIDFKHLQRCKVCDRAKYFSHPSLVMYSFATPPIKLKLGQQTGGGLLITNHLHQSLWWTNQKYRAPVKSYLLHSFFFQVQRSGEPFTSHGNVRNYAEPKRFSWVNRHILDFLHRFLLCRITHWAPLEMLLVPEAQFQFHSKNLTGIESQFRIRFQERNWSWISIPSLDG